MQITAKRDGARLSVRFEGELDHHSAAPARVKLDGMLADTSIRCLALDMRGVTFMDSSGLGVILGRYRILSERGGRMEISGASRYVERILKMAGVYTLLEQRDGKGGRAHV